MSKADAELTILVGICLIVAGSLLIRDGVDALHR